MLGVADATLILAAADAIATGDGRATLEATESLARSGRDVAQFGRDLLAHLRRLLIIRAAGEGFGADELQAAEPARMEAQAESFTDLGLTRAIDSVSAALAAIREGDEPRMTMELALLGPLAPSSTPAARRSRSGSSGSSRRWRARRRDTRGRRLDAATPKPGSDPSTPDVSASPGAGRGV